MNLFNRFLVSLVFLALGVRAVAVIVLAWTMPQDSIDGLRDAVDWLDRNNEDLEKALLTIIAAIVALLAFLVLVMELMPATSRDVKVTDVDGAHVVLSTASIGQRVEEAVRQVPNVSAAKAQVTAKRKGVEVFLDLHVDPEANLASTADAAIAAARFVLNEKVHVAIVQPPRVRMHYRELRLQRPAAPASKPAEPSPAEPAPAPVATDGEWKPPEAEQAPSAEEPARQDAP